MQFYIITGGQLGTGVYTSSTEILKKNGGTKWQQVANLPSPRTSAGVSLPNGNFMVSGERWRITKPSHIFIFIFIFMYVLCLMYLSLLYVFIGGYYNEGGQNRKYHSEVMIYNSDKDKWTTVGQLGRSRSGHAMSVVPKETAKYCV